MYSLIGRFNINILQQVIEEQILINKNLSLIIINAEAINSLDSSAVHMLKELYGDLDRKGIKLVFAGVKGPVRDIMMKNQLVEEFGHESFYDNISDALMAYDGKKINKSRQSFQTNLKIPPIPNHEN